MPNKINRIIDGNFMRFDISGAIQKTRNKTQIIATGSENGSIIFVVTHKNCVNIRFFAQILLFCVL